MKLKKKIIFENQSLDFILPQLMSNIVEGISTLNCVIVSKTHPDCVIKIVEQNVSKTISELSILKFNFDKELNFEFPKSENGSVLAASDVYIPIVFKKSISEDNEEIVESISLTELQLAISGLLTDETGYAELSGENWEMDKKIWTVYELMVED